MVRVSRTSPILGRLLTLLAERDRLVLTADMLAAFRDRVREHQNVVLADVATAVPLSPVQARAITDSLARAVGRQVDLTTRVDPGIIGGLVARIGSTVYDGSVTTTLRKMKERLRAAGA
jgi:F-type H+-transporting ATPase subunit delta